MSHTGYGEAKGTQPIFVSGVYRSGTTFLVSLLGSHPDLYAASNTIKFIRFCLGRYGPMSLAENRRQLVEETASRVAVRWGAEIDSEAVLTAAGKDDEPSYALLYELLMRQLLTKDVSKPVRWVEKVNLMWSSIPSFLDMFPHGRVVHIVRDPRDVTASYKQMTFEPGNTYLDAAFNCLGAMESIANLDKHYRDRVFVVRAEDLAKERDSLIPELQRFLGLKPSKDMFDPNKLASEGEDWSTNTSYGKPYTNWPDANPRWPEFLERSETIFVELITKPWLFKYGYKSSGFVPDSKEWAQMYSLVSEDDFLMDRLTRWLHTGKGVEGYRTDPYHHEMKIVFPERYR